MKDLIMFLYNTGNDLWYGSNKLHAGLSTAIYTFIQKLNTSVVLLWFFFLSSVFCSLDMLNQPLQIIGAEVWPKVWPLQGSCDSSVCRREVRWQTASWVIDIWRLKQNLRLSLSFRMSCRVDTRQTFLCSCRCVYENLEMRIMRDLGEQ